MTAQYAAGPERFLASTAGPKPSVWRSLLSGFLLLLLIVGVPALLVMTVGLPPLPHDLDVSVLTRAISLETLLALLVWVVWLAWLQFAVCTAVETVSALRGRGMPVHVPLSGGIQGLARRLVITTLLVGAIGAPVAAAAPVAEGPSQAASISQQVDATGAQESAPDAGTAGATGAGSGTSDGNTQGQENVRYMLGDTELDQETGAQLVGQRVYVVQPPEGRYHDNLWDIAERNLGDGRAYSQIYDLNVGRVQYDGRSLELARLIQPGWLLAMPESATNVDRVVAVPDVNPAPAPPVDQTADQSGGNMVDDTAGRQEILPAEAPAVGSLLAASLLAVLARRRRQWAGARPGETSGTGEAAVVGPGVFDGVGGGVLVDRDAHPPARRRSRPGTRAGQAASETGLGPAAPHLATHPCRINAERASLTEAPERIVRDFPTASPLRQQTQHHPGCLQHAGRQARAADRK